VLNIKEVLPCLLMRFSMREERPYPSHFIDSTLMPLETVSGFAPLTLL
jgi:hypothetical protein